MASLASYTIKDWGGESSVTTLYLREHTGTAPADYDGIYSTTPGSDREILRAAIQSVTRGVIAKETLTAVNQKLTNANATNPEAQREEKMLVIFEDDVTKELFNFEIAAVDISALTRIADTDFVDLTAPPMDTFVTDIESAAFSKNGNPISILRAVLVGRRS
jgi:hypothetical protein